MEQNFTSKDFISDQEVKWCPGCGDYSILKQMQSILPEIGIEKEKIVFISGIGCSSRFPYYMNTYGMHTIHGRAPAIATGLKITNPDLNIWIITGDGDGLSIGGNHLIHLFRRNINVNILLFNNEIYGLTKGQYSPTSHLGLKTKTSPLGVIDYPFNPLSLVIGAEATFVARTIDKDPKHLREMLLRSQKHQGTSFLEIYQNCVIFNDGVFDEFSNKQIKKDNTIFVEHGKPLIFGENNSKGIFLNNITPEIVDLNNFSINDLWIHDEHDITKANILSRFFNAHNEKIFPQPFGVIYSKHRDVYENILKEQINISKSKNPIINIDEIISGKNHWVIK